MKGEATKIILYSAIGGVLGAVVITILNAQLAKYHKHIDT